MAQKASVVTPERFARGHPYNEYFQAVIKVNKDRFQQYWDSYQPRPEDVEFFRRAKAAHGGPATVLCLGEDWCPDVYRGMPVMAKLAELAGLEFRVFPRDQNLDIMDEFLKDGQFRSIPVFVFYTKDGRYLCHWIERPGLANEERARIEAEVKAQVAGEEAQRAESRRRSQARYPAWQQAEVDEIRALVSRATGIT
ncbi:MAG: thioredoxin family protein [Chloroflexi bacterium]|nr:thioredoxin family protein [Chloroflexota bacterium]